MILIGAVFGRWWRVTLLVSAVGWPVLLVVTGAMGIRAALVGVAGLALLNAGAGVLLHQGIRHSGRKPMPPATSEPPPADNPRTASAPGHHGRPAGAQVRVIQPQKRERDGVARPHRGPNPWLNYRPLPAGEPESRTIPPGDLGVGTIAQDVSERSF